MGYVIANIHVDAMFGNNVPTFLLSMFRYKVVKRPEWATLVPIPLFLYISEWGMMASARRAGDGEAYGAFLQLMAESLQSMF